VEDADGPREVQYTGRKYTSKLALRRFLEKNSDYLISKRVGRQEISNEGGKALVVLCVEDVDKADFSDFYATARKYKAEGFRFIAATNTGKDSAKVGCILPKTKEPTSQMAILHTERPSQATLHLRSIPKYVSDSSFTGEGAARFIEGFKAGNLKRYLKSAEEPDHERYTAGLGAGILTGNSFEDVVYDDKSDTLVMFHAPWCKQCAEFEPNFDKAAKYMKKHYYDKGHNIILMKADVEDNDYPETLSKFPTMRLYPGGMMAKKRKSVLYGQPVRRPDLVLDFITENSYVLQEGKEECQWAGRDKEPAQSGAETEDLPSVEDDDTEDHGAEELDVIEPEEVPAGEKSDL